MARKSPELQVIEIPGDEYKSLVDAQRAARRALAGELAAILRSLQNSTNQKGEKTNL